MSVEASTKWTTSLPYRAEQSHYIGNVWRVFLCVSVCVWQDRAKNKSKEITFRQSCYWLCSFVWDHYPDGLTRWSGSCVMNVYFLAMNEGTYTEFMHSAFSSVIMDSVTLMKICMHCFACTGIKIHSVTHPLIHTRWYSPQGKTVFLNSQPLYHIWEFHQIAFCMISCFSMMLFDRLKKCLRHPEQSYYNYNEYWKNAVLGF